MKYSSCADTDACTGLFRCMNMQEFTLITFILICIKANAICLMRLHSHMIENKCVCRWTHDELDGYMYRPVLSFSSLNSIHVQPCMQHSFPSSFSPLSIVRDIFVEHVTLQDFD